VRLPSANQPKGGSIRSATTVQNIKKPSHTLEVQVGEYPFGVVNGLPLEL